MIDRLVPRARGDRFEDQYMDVLQNIEFGIVRIFNERPELTDWDVLTAVEALMRTYRDQKRGQAATDPSLPQLSGEVYTSVKMMCDWRLGQDVEVTSEEGEPVDIAPEPITLDEIVACLKRVRKSINRWSKQGGRQGYLNFVSQFIA